MSSTGGRKPSCLMSAARHNLREIQAELGAVKRINPGRVADNSIMFGPSTAVEVKAVAERLLGSVDTSKLKKDHVQAIETVFSLPPHFDSETGQYFAKCLSWLSASMDLPVLSAVVHRDEAAPHMHVLMLPVRDGRHVGGAPIAKESLKKLRESFFNQVAGPAGLRRDGGKLRGVAKQRAVEAILGWCEAGGFPRVNGPLWAVLEAAIRRDPAAVLMAMQIDADELARGVGSQGDATPIGLEQNPIGLHSDGVKDQALSCVGLHSQTMPVMRFKAVASPPELWERVGCKVLSDDLLQDRVHIARKAQQTGIERHRNTERPAIQSGALVVRDDVVIVRDEFADDLTAWDGF